jgi:glycosyltransferase involved in cell wall biosynthesis
LNSSCEPFGLVVAEAMASGTPVVAAAVGGVPEIIENGISGLLFARGDSQALLTHLRALAKDQQLVRGLVRAGRARVEARFDLAEFQTRILMVYEKFAAARFQPGNALHPRAR